VRFYLRGTLNVFNASNSSPLTIEFLNHTGTDPAEVSRSATYRQNGNQIEVDALYSVDGPFTFRGLRVRIDGPFATSSETMDYDVVTNPATTRIRFIVQHASSSEQFAWLEEAPVDATPAEPVLNVRGSRVRRINGRRTVLRGTALAEAGLASVEFKAGRARFRQTRGMARWRAVVRLPAEARRIMVRVRAADSLGRRTPTQRVRIIRRN